MTDIDKAVQQAQMVVASAHTDYYQRLVHDLARAVLAMAPVCAFARRQAEAFDIDWSFDPRGSQADWERATVDTEAAIRTLDAEADRG